MRKKNRGGFNSRRLFHQEGGSTGTAKMFLVSAVAGQVGVAEGEFRPDVQKRWLWAPFLCKVMSDPGWFRTAKEAMQNNMNKCVTRYEGENE